LCDRIACQRPEIAMHFRVSARAEGYFRLAQPQQRFGILRQSRGANTGNCQEMQQRLFAQRELLYDAHKRQRICWPPFAELDQSGLDLRRVQRCRRFLPNPAIPAIHRAKHHVILMETPITRTTLS